MTINTLPSNDPAALLAYRGRGNPLASHVSTAISNCFPGLEFDLRALWKNFLVGIELHEADNLVVAVENGSAAQAAGVAADDLLLSVAGQSVETMVRGPRTVGAPDADLARSNLEWSNALADLARRAGQSVECRFRGSNGELAAVLTVRRLFDGVAIAEEAAPPGVLTQGLCSPWQNDYRECGCYYWAASRPDFVNVELVGGQAAGHNWMHKDRTAQTPKVYVPDASGRPGQLTYEDLFRAWEEELRFVRRGRDSE